MLREVAGSGFFCVYTSDLGYFTCTRKSSVTAEMPNLVSRVYLETRSHWPASVLK